MFLFLMCYLGFVLTVDILFQDRRTDSDTEVIKDSVKNYPLEGAVTAFDKAILYRNLYLDKSSIRSIPLSFIKQKGELIDLGSYYFDENYPIKVKFNFYTKFKEITFSSGVTWDTRIHYSKEGSSVTLTLKSRPRKEQSLYEVFLVTDDYKYHFNAIPSKVNHGIDILNVQKPMKYYPFIAVKRGVDDYDIQNVPLFVGMHARRTLFYFNANIQYIPRVYDDKWRLLHINYQDDIFWVAGSHEKLWFIFEDSSIFLLHLNKSFYE